MQLQNLLLKCTIIFIQLDNDKRLILNIYLYNFSCISPYEPLIDSKWPLLQFSVTFGVEHTVWKKNDFDKLFVTSVHICYIKSIKCAVIKKCDGLNFVDKQFICKLYGIGVNSCDFVM